MKIIIEKGQAVIEYIFILTITLFVLAFIIRLVVSDYLSSLPKLAIETIEIFFEKLIKGEL